MRLFWYVGVACVVVSSAAVAQSSSNGYVVLDSNSAGLPTSVTLSLSNTVRRDVIRAISTQSGMSIVFDPALPGLDERVTVQFTQVPAATALLRVLAGSGTRAMVAPASRQVVLVADVRRTRKVSGMVRSADGPVSGAHVVIGAMQSVTTREDGSFTLATVPTGTSRVHVMRLGYRPLATSVDLAADDTTPVMFAIEREAIPLEKIIVTPGYFGLLETSVAMPQTLSREQLQTVPQIGEDIYRAINRLPGVAASDFSARFSVRGAPADQLYVTLDGLRLIEPFHLKDIGSALSIIDIQTLGNASLISGGAGAAFGDEIGGVFTMHSLDPRQERSRRAVGISLTNLRANAQGTFADEKGGWLVSGRRGFLDLAFKLTNLADSLKPRYDDAFAKVQYALPHGGEVAVHALHSGDQLKYLDNGDAFIESRYLANYGWLTLDQPLGERVRTHAVLSIGGLDWQRRGQSSNQSNPWGTVDDSRSLLALEWRNDWSVTISPRSVTTFGVDLRNDRAKYQYRRSTHITRAVSTVLQTMLDTLRSDVQPEGTSTGAYISQRLQLSGAVTVDAGVRFDHTAGYGDKLVSPRLAGAWRLTSSSTVLASWGKYAQAQPLFALQVEDGQERFSPADRSEQVDVALMQLLPGALSAQVNAYRRMLTAERARYLNATSRNTPFSEVEYDRVLFAPSGGKAEGVEFALSSADRAGMAWSINYALAKATDRMGTRDVPRVSDQRHAVHADWSWHPADNAWRFAAAVTWHSGTPDTPEVVRVDTLVNTPTRFDLFATWSTGALFSERTSAYSRMDMRWTRYFQTSHGRISLFAEVWNALGTVNPRGYYTTVNVNGRNVTFVRGVRDQMPRLPSAGFTWEM